MKIMMAMVRSLYLHLLAYVTSLFVQVLLCQIWDEYNKLRREVKHLVMEKKLNVWNGVGRRQMLILKAIRVICR